MEKSGVRLPTKQTTRHIPRTQQPEGSVNSKGYIKILDNETGKTRWIDKKKGVALDLQGDPTHDRF